MRYEDWNNGLNQIDMSFIEEYIDEKRKYKKKRSIRSLAVRMSAAAACAAIIFTAIIVPIKMIDHSLRLDLHASVLLRSLPCVQACTKSPLQDSQRRAACCPLRFYTLCLCRR